MLKARRECLTDNVNRTGGFIREILNDNECASVLQLASVPS
jgi:transcriptional/translational regulatory protein YebC/TACO1